MDHNTYIIIPNISYKSIYKLTTFPSQICRGGRLRVGGLVPRRDRRGRRVARPHSGGGGGRRGRVGARAARQRGRRARACAQATVGGAVGYVTIIRLNS